MHNVVYMGYSDAMMSYLMMSDEFKIIMVVGKRGRMCQKQYEMIERYKLPYQELCSPEDMEDLILPADCEFCILMYKFEYIIPAEIVEKYKIINFHGGSLKYNRGAHAPVWSILNQDKETCLSMYQLTGGIDEGLLIDEYPVRIDDLDDLGTLNRKLADGIPVLLKQLSEYLEGRLCARLVTGGKYNRKIKERDYTICLDKDDIDSMIAKIKSQRTYFGALILHDGKKYRVKDYIIEDSDSQIRTFINGAYLIADNGIKKLKCALLPDFSRGGYENKAYLSYLRCVTVKCYKEEKDIRDVLLEFRKHLFNKDMTAEKLSTLAKKFSDCADFICVRTDSGNMGYISFYTNDRRTWISFISMIVVKKEYSCRGIGTFLIKMAERLAFEQGMKEISLNVSDKNFSAISFYIKNGYHIHSSVQNGSLTMKKVIRTDYVDCPDYF